MPIEPGKKESDSEFLSRCIATEKRANPDMDIKQCSAICYSKLKESKKKKTENGVKRFKFDSI